MKTAAEALEKLIRLERNLEKKCHDLGYYNMIHVGLREFVEHAETFRAALAPPQEGEVEECLRKIDRALQVVFALCKGEQKWVMSIPVNEERDPDIIIADALSFAARLLRATQSNGRSSGSCSNGNAGDGPGQLVAGESPAQSAPAHDALAGQTNNGRPKQPRSISEGREVEAWKYYLDGCWHVCLDEDSDEHIRENGIALSTHEYRWEWK